MGFGKGFLIFFVVDLIPIVVSPVGSFPPCDGWYDGRWEGDGEVVRTSRTGGFGFCERRDWRGSPGDHYGGTSRWGRSRGWSGKGVRGGIVRQCEELVDCFFIMFEVESHVCGGEGVYEGVEEIPYGGRGESINEVAKTMVVKEVEDDKA